MVCFPEESFKWFSSVPYVPLKAVLNLLIRYRFSEKTKVKAIVSRSSHLKNRPVGFSRGPSYTSNKVVVSKHHIYPNQCSAISFKG